MANQMAKEARKELVKFFAAARERVEKLEDSDKTKYDIMSKVRSKDAAMNRTPGLTLIHKSWNRRRCW